MALAFPLFESPFRRVLVSGGAGFIGSALVRMLTLDLGVEVVNVDALTYAGNLSSLASVAHGKSARLHHFYHQDICNGKALVQIFMATQPQAVLHLAAQTHVDRSIDAAQIFVRANVQGTLQMLEAARAYWQTLPAAQQKQFRFLHVSTDEVYGDLPPDAPPADEGARYAPSSPYAASKAGADHLVRAWHRTYGLPVLLTHCCNNYGPYQHPEKLIPHLLLCALQGKELPIYGDGQQQRQWLTVEDHVCALWQVLLHGRRGETYHISSPETLTNLALAERLCALLELYAPARENGVTPYTSRIKYVADRPGHDRRYALDARKIESELGWKPQISLEEGLQNTIQWYLQHRDWWQQVREKGYMLQRQGLSQAKEAAQNPLGGTR